MDIRGWGIPGGMEQHGTSFPQAAQSGMQFHDHELLCLQFSI